MRVKGRTRRLLLPAASVLGGGLARLLAATCRLEIDAESRRRLEQLPTPSLFACWHEQIVLSMPLVRQLLQPAGHELVIMASHSDDGQLVTDIARSLNLAVVRGSTSRGGREGLRALYREVSQRHRSPLILPDGPKGPAHESKAGVVVLSQMSGAPIAPMGLAASSGRRIRSWDRMTVPRPWSTVRCVVGEPIHVPRELPDELRAEHLRRLDEVLVGQQELATRLL